MKRVKNTVARGLIIFVIFTLVCGIGYTLVVTAIAQILFPNSADGSIIEIDGKKYGSEYLAQQYTEEEHMWGRIMNIDVTTYRDKDGKPLMYAAPSNLSPASSEYQQLVAARVEKIKKAHPQQDDLPIPVDLVTCSGSGLDPHISIAAANYQVSRLAEANNLSEKEVEDIIESCTDGPFIGIFGEATVNVLEVNLMLEGILK